MPQPRDREVRVKVAACGVCHTDLHVLKGEVAFPTPSVLGHEVSGVVDAIGPGVTNVDVGDRVVCSFIMPCGACAYCVRGREDLCETFFAYNRLKGQLYDGTTRLGRPDGTPIAMYSMGGLAEYAVTPDTSVFRLPESVPLTDAAIVGCSIFTAYGAVRNQADIRPGQRVAVFAVGGVGTQVLQMARAFGASQIIAVDIRGDKLEMALGMGATDVVNSAAEDAPARVRELTGGRGVDVAIEARSVRRSRCVRRSSPCVTAGRSSSSASRRRASRFRWRSRGSCVAASRSSAPTAQRRAATCRRSWNSCGAAQWTPARPSRGAIRSTR